MKIHNKQFLLRRRVQSVNGIINELYDVNRAMIVFNLRNIHPSDDESSCSYKSCDMGVRRCNIGTCQSLWGQ